VTGGGSRPPKGSFASKSNDPSTDGSVASANGQRRSYSATWLQGKDAPGGAGEVARYYRGRGGPVWIAEIPGTDAVLVDPPGSLSPIIAEALRLAGRSRLFSHQRATIEAVQAGKDVALVTSTASGKTLGFNAAVLDGLLRRGGRALYLYPLNALANDQHAALKSFIEHIPIGDRPRIGLSTGQSTTDERRAARDGDIVLTNPEMLHFSILRNPRLWRGLLGRLQFVVIDEAHLYRGAFGAHMAHLMRRLTRLSQESGAVPQFIVASATIGNPGELATALTRRSFEVISEDGSAKPPRQLVVWEPPSYTDQQGNRRFLSYEDEAVALLRASLNAGRSAILFVRSRRSVEAITDAIKNELVDEPQLADAIAPYRGGYSAAERKAIENGLRAGLIRAVVSTVALEAGIDIGTLDVAIIAGYPGTMMSFWQQAGRAGRRGKPAQIFFVPSGNALDAYFATAPDRLLETPHELATFDPWNPHIATVHTLWSANETGLPVDGPWENDLQGIVASRLLREGALEPRGGRSWPTTEVDYEVSLRAIEGRPYKIVDERGHEVGEQDEDYLLHECHVGAVYVHKGQSYRVIRLDEAERQVVVRGPEPWKIETKVEMVPELRVLETVTTREIGPGQPWQASLVRFEVTERYLGYVETERKSGKLLQAVTFPQELIRTRPTMGVRLELPFTVDGDSAHAIEHAVLGMVPTQVMCDRTEFFGRTEGSIVSLYERHRDGLGFAQKVFERLEEILGAASDRLAECDCVTGCPSCVQSPVCERWNDELAKTTASMNLDSALGVVRESRQSRSPGPAVQSAASAMQIARSLADEISAEQRDAYAMTRPSAVPSPDRADGWSSDDQRGIDQYRVGESVRHRAFGTGEVVKVGPRDGVVVVRFEKVGLKSIAGSRGHLDVRTAEPGGDGEPLQAGRSR
jgi:DEAD/DEAH box helicase domain-containing protein